MLDNLWKFIHHWWFRYLLVTELYMAEGWERVAIRESIRSVIKSIDNKINYVNVFFLFK